MIFNSYIFLLLFLPVVVAVYWWLSPRQTSRLWWLLVASMVFYAYADWRHALLLVIVGLLGYAASQQIAHSESRGQRRLWLAVGSGVFLLPLAYFKYTNFAAGSAQSLLSLFGWQVELGLFELALPLGISFYTFKGLSYILDVHNRRLEPAASPLGLLVYLALFQELVAGPISRFRNTGPQLAALPAKLTEENSSTAAYLIVFGLAKKVLIADRLAVFVDPLLAQHTDLGFFSAWAGVLGYSLQLYFDFSGYSDMAAGLGQLFGLSLLRNFQNPYRAENISLFWNRWHITLSHWFRDYVFFPLSRGWLKRSPQRAAMVRSGSHLVTMSLVGLWHGASWTFVLWGAYHGLLLAGHATLRGRLRLSWPRAVSVALTFLLVVIGWAIFRSETPAMLGHLLTAMAGFNGFESLGMLDRLIGLRLLLLILAGLGITYLLPDSWDIPRSTRRRAEIALALLLAVSMVAMGETVTFLYRQF